MFRARGRHRPARSRVLVSRLGRDAVRRHYRRLPSDTNATRQQRCGPRLPVLQPLVADWLWNVCRRERATWCWSLCRCWLFSSTTATDVGCRLGHIRARRCVSCVRGARSLIPCARNRDFTAPCHVSCARSRVRVIGLGRDDVRRRYRRRGCEHVDRTRREIDHDHRCTQSPARFFMLTFGPRQLGGVVE